MWGLSTRRRRDYGVWGATVLSSVGICLAYIGRISKVLQKGRRSLRPSVRPRRVEGHRIQGLAGDLGVYKQRPGSLRIPKDCWSTLVCGLLQDEQKVHLVTGPSDEICESVMSMIVSTHAVKLYTFFLIYNIFIQKCMCEVKVSIENQRLVTPKRRGED